MGNAQKKKARMLAINEAIRKREELDRKSRAKLLFLGQGMCFFQLGKDRVDIYQVKIEAIINKTSLKVSIPLQESIYI